MSFSFKLGKLPPRIDRRTLKLRDYLVSLPPIPSAIDWTGKVNQWGMLANDAIGDCAIAAPMHQDEVWTGQTIGEIVPTDAQAIADYSAITGYDPSNPDSDTGCVMLDVLNYWRQTGIGGRKITAYVATGLTQADIQASIALFGSANIGLKLPSRAMQQFEDFFTWDDTGPDDIIGGHDVAAVAYTSLGVTLITWGRKQYASWPWLLMYMDEAYAALSPDWFKAGGLSPSNWNQAQLEADLLAVQSAPAQ